jgi:hypothetical protein
MVLPIVRVRLVAGTVDRLFGSRRDAPETIKDRLFGLGLKPCLALWSRSHVKNVNKAIAAPQQEILSLSLVSVRPEHTKKIGGKWAADEFGFSR